jgi:hypothetical protein
MSHLRLMAPVGPVARARAGRDRLGTVATDDHPRRPVDRRDADR